MQSCTETSLCLLLSELSIIRLDIFESSCMYLKVNQVEVLVKI